MDPQIEKAIEELAEASTIPGIERDVTNALLIDGQGFPMGKAVSFKLEHHAKYNELVVSVSYRVPYGADPFTVGQGIQRAVRGDLDAKQAEGVAARRREYPPDTE